MTIQKFFKNLYRIVLVLLTVGLIATVYADRNDLASTKETISVNTQTIWREDSTYSRTTTSGTRIIIEDPYTQDLIDGYINRQELRFFLILALLMGYPLATVMYAFYYNRIQEAQEKYNAKRDYEAYLENYKRELLLEEIGKAERRKNMAIFDCQAFEEAIRQKAIIPAKSNN